MGGNERRKAGSSINSISTSTGNYNKRKGAKYRHRKLNVPNI
jgi:hypothetical protein